VSTISRQLRNADRSIAYVFVASMAILLFRTVRALDRFPSDPGYKYVYSSTTDGVASWFELDPYLHFGAHFFSWLASFSPLEYQAFVNSILVHFLWSFCAIGILLALRSERVNKRIAIVCSLLLAISPVAAESSLGNVGNIKWPLLVLAIIVASSSTLVKHPGWWSVYFALTGLTNPILPIVLLPMFIRFGRSPRAEQRRLWLPVLSVLSVFIVQSVLVGLSGLGSGAGGTKVFEPWSGMGVFWWYGLTMPSLLGLSVLVAVPVLRVRPAPTSVLAIATSAPTLAVVTYFYGGIGDRYFVGPLTLAGIASVALATQWMHHIPKLVRFGGIMSVVVVLALPAVKWFGASWYLTNGPSWSSAVETARQACASNLQSVTVPIGAIDSMELPCSYFTNRR